MSETAIQSPIAAKAVSRFVLTFNEMTVLTMMATKRSPKEIRERLAIGGYAPSSDVVLRIVHGIREKLGCRVGETLVECARRQGVIR